MGNAAYRVIKADLRSVGQIVAPAQGSGMAIATKPIAVVQGAESAIIQQLLADFWLQWRTRARIVGLIEDPMGDSCDTKSTGGRMPGQLRNLAELRHFPIFQDLGPGSTGCALDGASLVAAGEQVRRDIAAGCDLVVLSKFGKFEAENGSGLLPAFIDAIAAGAMVLTSVAPKFMPAWGKFAEPYYVIIPAEPQAIETWWAEAFGYTLNDGKPGANNAS